MGPAREAAASGAARDRRARATRARPPARPSWSLARRPAPARPTPPPTREGERAASSVQQLLDDHAIAPVTGELAVPLVDADDAESTGLVQPEACGFRVVGVYERHGKLAGDWRDCVIVEKLLDR